MRGQRGPASPRRPGGRRGAGIGRPLFHSRSLQRHSGNGGGGGIGAGIRHHPPAQAGCPSRPVGPFAQKMANFPKFLKSRYLSMVIVVFVFAEKLRHSCSDCSVLIRVHSSHYSEHLNRNRGKVCVHCKENQSKAQRHSPAFSCIDTMRLRGAGRPISSTIGKVRAQDIKLKKIRKAYKAKIRYKAGTVGFLPFVGPHLYALGGRSTHFELRCRNS